MQTNFEHELLKGSRGDMLSVSQEVGDKFLSLIYDKNSGENW